MHRRSGLLSLSLLAPLLLDQAAAAQSSAPGIEPTPISSLPLTISTPGADYLHGGLTGVAGQGGILINASDVNLNLNGHQLRGVPGSASGIAVTSEGRARSRSRTARSAAAAVSGSKAPGPWASTSTAWS